MKTLYRFFLAFLIIQSYQTLFAQNEGAKLSTYDKDGLKFEYPSDWILTDKSAPEIQTFYLTKEKSTALIIISSPREILVASRQYEILQKDSKSKYSAAVSESFSTADKEADSESVCLSINDNRKILGTRFKGIYNNEPATGDVYSFALGNRLLTLVYFKIDKESQLSDAVWENLVKSLYTKDLKNHDKEETAFFRSGLMDGGVMNGKALKLVKPMHPGGKAKSGVVVVKVVIDEKGKVISAKPIAGDLRFYGVSVIAAEASKFSPTTICDKAVRVTGTIVYNFVPKK